MHARTHLLSVRTGPCMRASPASRSWDSRVGPLPRPLLGETVRCCSLSGCRSKRSSRHASRPSVDRTSALVGSAKAPADLALASVSCFSSSTACAHARVCTS